MKKILLAVIVLSITVTFAHADGNKDKPASSLASFVLDNGWAWIADLESLGFANEGFVFKSDGTFIKVKDLGTWEAVSNGKYSLSGNTMTWVFEDEHSGEEQKLEFTLSGDTLSFGGYAGDFVLKKTNIGVTF